MTKTRTRPILVLIASLMLIMACFIPDSGVFAPESTSTGTATATERAPVEKNATVGVSMTTLPKNATVTALRALNVRIEPGIGHPVIGTLKSGASVALLGECNEYGWRMIVSGTLIGWVNADYLDGGCE